MYFRYFSNISPWKRRGCSFEQIWIPFTKESFVPSLIEIGRMVLKKKMNMWKVYDNANDDNDYDNDDDDDGQRTNFDQKSSLEPSA